MPQVAASYVKELMAKLPPMRPLLFILKIFLQQREMNEVCLQISCPTVCCLSHFHRDISSYLCIGVSAQACSCRPAGIVIVLTADRGHFHYVLFSHSLVNKQAYGVSC